ncbi:glycosyltransferase family 39 protein [Patescibacteria group bacterium]|nr:glycosyltransferase family 39 protein [Patescibacteria group bacterium]MBU1472741.1 glycosyltransferase family 39 protein [Patescibacteria group bacterium]MBU2460008.1 glycosyltransferase family 39 protein [Patescibacteria group bacterium]MBU2544334.1 glycosyltransferase family 39 protein [Patescibacteria group bacterium]
MSIWRKRWVKTVTVGIIFIAAYFITRVINLSGLPIFTDEAIYIRWSQIGSRDASWRFISLVDGKQPMFTWVMMVFLKLLPSWDPLVVGRLVSVASGFLTMVGLWLLARELFRSRKIAWIAALLYVISPFTLMYDRMALYDSMVAAFSVWNLYFSVMLVRNLRLDIALLLGMSLGLGMLNKTSGVFGLYLLPFTLILFDWKKKAKTKRLLTWVVLAFIASVLSMGFYSILRLSPLFGMVKQKDAVFVYPLSEWITHPFRFLIGNLRGELDWASSYLTWPVYALSLVPLCAVWSKYREKLLLYVYWFLPFVALALFGKVLYPRFILFMCMPLLVLAAVSVAAVLRRIKTIWLQVIMLLAICAVSMRTSYLILTNPVVAPIPKSDSGQYINDWPSGWGVREVNAFILKESKTKKITVFTEGTFGLMPYGLEIYLVDKPNIEIRGIWPLPEDMPKIMIESTLSHTTYFVMNQTQIPPENWSLSLIAQYPKGNRLDRLLRLYAVVPPLARLSTLTIK